ncbi:LOW QUALITY PROTEIN: hypothetical protein HZS_3045 [Henneguya salminicola]|nr:LOW QUALITY PROTEIN: hypothetical protein HZS_3045 [Henneguya salminicola]
MERKNVINLVKIFSEKCQKDYNEYILDILKKFLCLDGNEINYKSNLVFGYNEIVRKIEKEMFSLVLINNSANPNILVQHLIYLCNKNSINFLIVENLEKATKECNIKKILVLALKFFLIILKNSVIVGSRVILSVRIDHLDRRAPIVNEQHRGQNIDIKIRHLIKIFSKNVLKAILISHRQNMVK